MPAYPTDEDIDAVFPTNTSGDISAADMRDFQKSVTGAGRTYGAIRVFDAADTYLSDELVEYGNEIYRATANSGPGEWDSENFVLGSATYSSGVVLHMNWTNTIIGQVPSGGFGTDDVDPNLATVVRISSETRQGADINPFMENIAPGDFIGFAQEGRADKRAFYFATDEATLVSGTPDYYTFPIVALDVNYPIDDGGRGNVSLVSNPARILPPGGTTGQVLTKTSDKDFAVGWV